MLRKISRPLVLWLLVGCGASSNPRTTSVADHERNARDYEATATAIEIECWKDRRSQLTVDDPANCWKAEDLRFLEANRNAAIKHRAEAVRLRGETQQTARR